MQNIQDVRILNSTVSNKIQQLFPQVAACPNFIGSAQIDSSQGVNKEEEEEFPYINPGGTSLSD